MRSSVIPILLLALTLSAQAGAQVSPPIKIGFLIADLTNERWQIDVADFKKRASELRATVVIEDGQSDEALQLTQAKALLKRGVKVLVVNAQDAAGAAEIVNAAKLRRVPVICYDRMILNSAPALYVSFDSVRVGEMQAAALVGVAPRGNYILIGGSPSDNNAKLVRQGQMSVLKPYIDRGALTIVSEGWAKDWSGAAAYMLVREALEKTKDIAAIVASNDLLASGALQAIQESGIKDKIALSGQDADLSATIRIIRGTQTMTVYKSISVLAKIAAESAVTLARGKALKTTVTTNNGSFEIASIILTPVAVNRANLLDTVIHDKFQNEEPIRKELSPEEWKQFHGTGHPVKK